MHEKGGENREIEPPWAAPWSPTLPHLRKPHGAQWRCVGAGVRPVAALGRSPVLSPARHEGVRKVTAEGGSGRRRAVVHARAHWCVAVGEWSLITAGDGPDAGLSGQSCYWTRPLNPRSFVAVSPDRSGKTGSVLRVSAAWPPDLCGHLGARSRSGDPRVASTLVAGG